MSQKFFLERTEQSRVKADIVKEFYDAWTKIMLKNFSDKELAYIDLFCGPGIYCDGNKSVPLKLIEHTLKNDNLSRKMWFYFNDIEQRNIQNLHAEISKLPGIEILSPKIRYANDVIDIDFPNHWYLQPGVPALSFVDPCGYKGLTLNLIRKLMINPGSDCIFFFNYNRINMAVNNPIVLGHLEEVFGAEKTANLKRDLLTMTSGQREVAILNTLFDALKTIECSYILPFRFDSQEQDRTSHYIIYVTKSKTGHSIMKDIMHKYSIKDQDDVATFAFEKEAVPGDNSKQLTFFSKLDDLCDNLTMSFAGKTISVHDLCDSVVNDEGTFFIKKNVKEALRRLEVQNRITVEGRIRKTYNKKITMPDNAFVVFGN